MAYVVLAFDEGQAVACGCFKIFSMDTVEMKRMFVLHGLRRQGISKLVLAELEKWAGELNYAFAVLETGNLQQAAISLYQKAAIVPFPITVLMSIFRTVIGLKNDCQRADRPLFFFI